MGSISVSGTGFVGRTRGLAASIILFAAPMLTGFAAPAALDVDVEGLRNGEGTVLVCLTRDADAFPDCREDPDAKRVSAEAGEARHLTFQGLATGDYALSIIHDENGNGRLDTLVRIPREGFGFSRNPRIRFGPPRFSDARFAVAAGENRQTVRIRYLL
jgi:uncharacterized protein (DUF2141 family)